MIRDYRPSDFEQIQQIFNNSGLPKTCMPDANHPLFVVKKVSVDEAGNLAMAAFTKVTAEQYLLVNHEWKTPRDRWDALRDLRDVVVSEVDARGFQDLTLWAPPQVEESFGKRLVSLGFVKSPWPSYSIIL